MTKRITIGILAHVDAGKTTLSEAFLYLTGTVRSLGRVDKKNTILDNYEAERRRGITIFSKQAHFKTGDTVVTLLDTPGHVDFAAEAERVLSVLDYAILVISAPDGVSGHTRTIWKLLSEYNVPSFIFVNKMDQAGSDKEAVLGELKGKLSPNIVDFTKDLTDKESLEAMALCDEAVLDKYLDSGIVSDDDIRTMISSKSMFPCFFGSALKLTGIEELLAGLDSFTMGYNEHNTINNRPAASCNAQTSDFGARVYKITRDDAGNRLTHLKVTAGTLATRRLIEESVKENEEKFSEKINRIRIYQGEKYESVSECSAGEVCAVTGLSYTYPGQGLGCESDCRPPVLAPVMTFGIVFEAGVDARLMYPKLKVLCEEDPLLNIEWNDDTKTIEVRLMGEVQTQILKETIKKRFDIDVSFDTGRICYRETIKSVAEGVGHFEPLRHYAEVHLMLEPGERGSGLVFDSSLSEDVLARNWQRLILTHLAEKLHRGVLTGSPITDMKITLVNGRAHPKHTEGGDFRQATYRAVRHGLMKAESVLLEPYYEFRMELTNEAIGRAMSDLDRMHANFNQPVPDGEMSVITGVAPVSVLNGYQQELVSYTKGRGVISFEYAGYYPCHNADEVIEKIGYDPQLDMRNPVGSVFCANGAGFAVDFADVEEYMHLENVTETGSKNAESEKSWRSEHRVYVKSKNADINERYGDISYSDDRELQEIFRRTYGDKKNNRQTAPVVYGDDSKAYDYADFASDKEKTSDNQNADKYAVKRIKKEESLKSRSKYLLVDGYNVIHANDELTKLMEISLEAARGVLADVLCNYQGFKDKKVILVFDAYKVKGNPGRICSYNNISIVYTKEAETADSYIERTAHEIGHNYDTTVVTSDGLEQVIIRGAGCRLMSSREFWEDVLVCEGDIKDAISMQRRSAYDGKNYLFSYLSDEMLDKLEKIRLGKS